MKQGIRWLLYTLGMLVLALGLTLNTKTGLGVSPIISVAFGVSEIWGLNFGDVTFLLYGLFVAGQIALRRGRGWLADLLQLPLSLAFSRVLNVYSAVIPYRCEAHSLWENLLLLAAAMLLTGIGAAVTVNMRLVPNPGDGIVAAVAERLGRDQGFGKNLVDVCCVALTCVIGLTAAGRNGVRGPGHRPGQPPGPGLDVRRRRADPRGPVTERRMEHGLSALGG